MSELLIAEPAKTNMLKTEERKDNLREVVETEGEILDSKVKVSKLIEAVTDCV